MQSEQIMFIVILRISILQNVSKNSEEQKENLKGTFVSLRLLDNV